MSYGSITIDEDIMEAAGFEPYEYVEVNGITRPARISTYVLPGERGSGIIGINGGASLHFRKGDHVHVQSFEYTHKLDEDNRKSPICVITNEDNKVKFIRHE